METEIQEREQKARGYFLEGYNCCQAVLLAFSDILDVDAQMLKKAGSGFGGGMGRMREVCGTVSAMVMASGFARGAEDPSDKASKTANYALVQELAEEFRKENGSIVCGELLGLRPMGASRSGSERVSESPEPSDRTEAYYKKRPCADLVACAAGILARKLLQDRDKF
ncbi:MAG: C-GCAxxG-C-C family protein [Candidatus Cryptobacteroides sp.]